MFRFALLPIIFFIGTILLGLAAYFIYRKIRRGIEFTYQKSSELANQQSQKWKQKDQLKKQPKLVQQGFNDFKQAEELLENLPEEWQTALQPLFTKASEILDEIISDPEFENNKLDSMRSFFIHTLDALKQFTQKLSTDHKHMSASDIEIARENIIAIDSDLQHYQQILQKKRKFDFDVLMAVIKARLKK